MAMNSMASNNPEASRGSVTDGANSYDSTDNERRRTVDGSAVGSATAKSNSSKSFFSLKKIKSSLSRKILLTISSRPHAVEDRTAEPPA